jgi:ABC-type transport system involved in cytochrome c biogenesis permease subunit
MGMQNLLVMGTGAAYVISASAYAAHFIRKQALGGSLGLWGLIAGWVLHSTLLARMALATGQVPLTSQVLPSLCAWLVVIVFLYLELGTCRGSLGALVVPIVVVLHLVAATNLMGVEEAPRVAHTGGWFKLHVVACILAYAAFAISSVSATMYVMLLGEIQKKHLGFFYDRLPPLDTLDQTNSRAASFGFVFLTAGIVASSVWVHQKMYRLWIWNEPAFWVLLVTWVVYAGHLAARRIVGWQGKRAAFLSILGFVLVVFTFPVMGLLFPGKHVLAQ